MDIIKGVLIVAFVLLVLVQDQDNSGMGGLLGGGNSAAFGSHSASVLTKATIVFVVLFFVVTFAIAKLLPTKSDSTDADMRAAAEASGAIIEGATAAPEATDGKWWSDSAASASSETATTESETTAPAEQAQ